MIGNGRWNALIDQHIMMNLNTEYPQEPAALEATVLNEVIRDSFAEYAQELISLMKERYDLDEMLVQNELIGVLHGYIDAYQD